MNPLTSRWRLRLKPAVGTLVGLLYAGLMSASWAAEGIAADLGRAVTPAVCGAGSQAETGLQGQVPLADRLSGRSQQGYSCNLEQVGRYQGEGATWVSAVAGHCAYMPTSGLVNDQKTSQGVQVIDVSRTDRPRLVEALDTRAFRAGTWESLKASPSGTMLAGVGVGLCFVGQIHKYQGGVALDVGFAGGGDKGVVNGVHNIDLLKRNQSIVIPFNGLQGVVLPIFSAITTDPYDPSPSTFLIFMDNFGSTISTCFIYSYSAIVSPYEPPFLNTFFQTFILFFWKKIPALLSVSYFLIKQR